VKSGRLKWAWITGIPLAWDATVTLTASFQKVFSSDPKVGFFKQRSVFQDAIDDGKVLPPAKSMDDMHTVVTNSTVDGILTAVLALLIVVVRGRRAGLCPARPASRPLHAERGAVRRVEDRRPGGTDPHPYGEGGGA
jgi:carbon starvation protein